MPQLFNHHLLLSPAKLILATVFLALISLTIIPAVAHAQLDPIDNTQCGLLGVRCLANTAGAGFGDIGTFLDLLIAAFLILLYTIATGFLIYAGYKYVMSFGDTEGATTAKRQISYALIGLFVAISASTIMALVGVDEKNQAQITPTAGPLISAIDPVITAMIFLIGTVATIFLVYAGFKYITSQGSEEASSTAKRQIAYALVGIFVATSAFALKALVGVQGNLLVAPSAGPLIDRLRPILGVMQLLIGTVATAYLMYAGFKYITSQGSEEASATAKRQIAYAIIGIFVAGSPTLFIQLIGVPGDPLFSGPTSGPLEAALETLINVFLSLVAVVGAIFLLYAGFKYISSRGDERESEQAKNQIVFALIGIVVAGLARVISSAAQTRNTDDLIINIRSVVNAFLTLAATAAAIYMVIAGVMYFTSQGDEEQAKRAKMQVVYGTIGIIIILLSGVIVNFVIQAI